MDGFDAESFAMGVRLYEHGLQTDGRGERYEMGSRSARHWMGRLLLLTALAAVPGVGVAQDSQEEGGTSFAGGQMVRGVVTTVATDHLTVKTETGEVYQVVTSANTRVTKDRQPVKLSDVKVGDGVGAMGVMDASTKTVHAVFVGFIDAEQVKKAREGMGKIYILGKITAIDMDALKITVMRPDGVSQVIGVDEGTSFKRGGRRTEATANGASEVGAGSNGGAGSAGNGGESITLADVKVGDSVAGRGGLKNGLFVPTELGVMDPSQRRRRRENGGGAAASGTAGSAGSVGVPR
jgi:hypothetical protein